MTTLEALLARKSPQVGRVKFIAIDGHGGSGKSSLADLLAQRLSAQIIHTDDFASWDNPLQWWPLVIEQVFQPIAAGVTLLSYTRSQWWENHDREPVTDQPVTDLMILEGVSSLRTEFRPYLSFGIFVETPAAVCLERGLARAAAAGMSVEEFAQLWRTGLEDENEYLERDQPQKYADMILDGTKPFEEQLE